MGRFRLLFGNSASMPAGQGDGHPDQYGPGHQDAMVGCAENPAGDVWDGYAQEPDRSGVCYNRSGP